MTKGAKRPERSEGTVYLHVILAAIVPDDCFAYTPSLEISEANDYRDVGGRATQEAKADDYRDVGGRKRQERVFENPGGGNIDSSVPFASLRVPQNDVTGAATPSQNDWASLSMKAKPLSLQAGIKRPVALVVFLGHHAALLRRRQRDRIT